MDIKIPLINNIKEEIENILTNNWINNFVKGLDKYKIAYIILILLIISIIFIMNKLIMYTFFPILYIFLIFTVFLLTATYYKSLYQNKL